MFVPTKSFTNLKPTLLIPPDFVKLLNPYTGQISSRNSLSKKNLKGLFRSPENQHYLADTLYRMLCEPSFVERHAAPPIEDYTDYQDEGYRTAWGMHGTVAMGKSVGRLVKLFKASKSVLVDNMQEMIEMQPLPFDEDVFVANPIMQLHHLNRDFLLKSGQNLVQNPEMLAPRYFARNPETGTDESNIEWDYTSESYADGTWHPEHLFTNCKRNRDHPYWEPLEINFYSESDAQGIGHRYYNSADVRKTGFYAHSQRTRSQFPRWDDAGSRQQYEHSIDEALRDGGSDDRRVQIPHGYNMINLFAKSTY
jgi:hypothetical protein